MANMKFRYGAVIPCFNVGAACVPVLRETADKVQVCVAVDDGSTDRTLQVISDLGITNLKVLHHDENLGKGAALITGFRHILANSLDIDGVVTLDGDGQHDPEQIFLFIEEFERNIPDLIYGNRFANRKGMPWHRGVLNELSNSFISRICHQKILDSQCGFRLYSRGFIQDQIQSWNSAHYELETEILIQAARQNKKIASVPVTMIYSPETNKLSHHNLYDVIRIARVVTSSLLKD
jgi:glycosyltransferase involved in cell wall biosynthesis